MNQRSESTITRGCSEQAALSFVIRISVTVGFVQREGKVASAPLSQSLETMPLKEMTPEEIEKHVKLLNGDLMFVERQRCL